MNVLKTFIEALQLILTDKTPIDNVTQVLKQTVHVKYNNDERGNILYKRSAAGTYWVSVIQTQSYSLKYAELKNISVYLFRSSECLSGDIMTLWLTKVNVGVISDLS